MTGIIISGAVQLLLVSFMVIILSSLSFDLSDPRDRANSCYINNSVGIDRDIATVLQFIRCRIPEIYSELTDMYPSFDILTTGDLAGKKFGTVEQHTNQVTELFF